VELCRDQRPLPLETSLAGNELQGVAIGIELLLADTLPGAIDEVLLGEFGRERLQVTQSGIVLGPFTGLFQCGGILAKCRQAMDLAGGAAALDAAMPITL